MFFYNQLTSVFFLWARILTVSDEGKMCFICSKILCPHNKKLQFLLLSLTNLRIHNDQIFNIFLFVNVYIIILHVYNQTYIKVPKGELPHSERQVWTSNIDTIVTMHISRIFMSIYLYKIYHFIDDKVSGWNLYYFSLYKTAIENDH